ncbi:CIC11C00000005955 [Sungouiella intermedia]|uniref:CIC11C00000005955 n=1 Tax=Sungouiella intermedia TaxID=45354 RepID=A0A1L0C1K6_9ASCO|nr:CIC11C00000005955 [[Candida] intermedia]
MQVNLNSTFAEISALDKLAIFAPHWFYSYGLKPEVATFSVIIFIATTLVVIGSYSTISQPKLASDPIYDRHSSLWDPTDRDGSSLYIMLPESALNLNTNLIDYKSALTLPVMAASALFGLDYLIRHFDILKIKVLMMYITTMVVPTAYLTLNFLFTAFLRNIGYILGLKHNLGYFFNRYRLTHSNDDKSPLGVIEQFDLESMSMSKSELKDFQNWMLERNNAKLVKLHKVEVKKQNFAIVWDAKFLFTLPIAIALLVVFHVYNSETYKLKNVNWIVNNVIASVFAISGCMFTRVGSFKVGTLMLLALFAYDVYFVFGSTLMVSVATGIDLPVKIVVPTCPPEFFSWSEIWNKQMHEIRGGSSLLGLGDIAIPGAFISLCLRYDYFQYYNRTKLAFHHLRSIGTPKYFILAISAYVTGLCITITANHYSGRGQPALLYIVPSLLISVFGLATWCKELSQLWGFTEEIEAYPEKTAEQEAIVPRESDDFSEVESEEPSLQVVVDEVTYEFEFTEDESDDTYIIEEDTDDDEEVFDEEDLRNEIDYLLRDQEKETQ